MRKDILLFFILLSLSCFFFSNAFAKIVYFCSVKVLAVFLSLFVVFLSTTPCCAVETDEDVLLKEQYDSCMNDDFCQTCSPFYTCGACAGFTLVEYSGESLAIYSRPVQHFSGCLPFSLPMTTASIWQPPQLS